MDVNAQNASLALRTAATQRGLLDMIAGTAPLAVHFATRLQALRGVQAQLHELQCASKSPESHVALLVPWARHMAFYSRARSIHALHSTRSSRC